MRSSAVGAAAVAHRPSPSARSPARAAGVVADESRLLAGDLDQRGVDVAASARVLSCRRRDVREQVVQPVADQHVLEQRHRSAFRHDHGHLAAHLGQPVSELLGVAHRGRQRDDLYRIGQADDHFLPDGAAEPIGQVMHLIHHDEPKIAERAGPGVDHVAQHLGGHDDHRRLGIDRCVAGQQTDLSRTVPAHQIGVLLVRERLDGRRIETLAALRQRQEDGELSDDRLARSGRRGHQDARACFHLSAGVNLVIVEDEPVAVREGPNMRARLATPEPCVRLGWRVGGSHGSPKLLPAVGSIRALSGHQGTQSGTARTTAFTRSGAALISSPSP